MSDLAKLNICFDKKEQLRCLVCGGKDCPKCGLSAYKKLASPAINLLHSHWITDEIVAMQRPNEEALLAGALEDMATKKITAVFNLTEPGEHPYCGTGTLEESGFPYLPQTLMTKGSTLILSMSDFHSFQFCSFFLLFLLLIVLVKHFNFNWPDMTTPDMTMIDRIVYIACTEMFNGGKVNLILYIFLLLTIYYILY
jgi:hypothetical protein